MHSHMMGPLLHVCNGLTRPEDESMLAPDIRTTGHNDLMGWCQRAYQIFLCIHCLQKKQTLLFSCISLRKSNEFE